MWKPTPHPASWHHAQMLTWWEVPSPRWPQFPHLHPRQEERRLNWTAGRNQWSPTCPGLGPGLFGAGPQGHLPQSCCCKTPEHVFAHPLIITATLTTAEGASHPSVHSHVEGQIVGSSCDGILFSFERRKLTQATTHTSPEDALLSETGQSQKHRYHRAPLT